MVAHRVETTLLQDGVISLRDVPFRQGDSVEVLVLPLPAPATDSHYPLRGTPVTLIDATLPVADADWESKK